MKIDGHGLLADARRAAEKAYAPYSCFPVGAALLTVTGEVFAGCNVENASFSLTCCAERVAVFRAVAEGHRRFLAVAVWGPDDRSPVPCGACLQVLAEFGTDLRLILGNRAGLVAEYRLAELMPHPFSLPAGSTRRPESVLTEGPQGIEGAPGRGGCLPLGGPAGWSPAEEEDGRVSG